MRAGWACPASGSATRPNSSPCCWRSSRMRRISSVKSRTLRAYRQAEEQGQGAAIIEGAMADRATDRHVRMLLRRAAAMGRLEPGRALALGIIEAREQAEAQALWEG